MAEFKRLSDVEVVAEPIESANVLIEENGVIKKAPKTTIGGSSGSSSGGGAYIIRLHLNNSTHNEDIAALKEKVENGIPIIAIISSDWWSKVLTNYVLGEYAIQFYNTTIVEEDGEEFCAVERVTLGSNGTWDSIIKYC